MNAALKASLRADEAKLDLEALVNKWYEDPHDSLLVAIYRHLEPMLKSIKTTYYNYKRIDDFESTYFSLVWECLTTYKPGKSKFATYYMSCAKKLVYNFVRDLHVGIREGSLYDVSLYKPLGEDENSGVLADILPSKDDIFEEAELLSMFDGRERELVQLILDCKNTRLDEPTVLKHFHCCIKTYEQLKQNIREVLMDCPQFIKRITSEKGQKYIREFLGGDYLG